MLYINIYKNNFIGSGSIKGYNQVWLRGDGPLGHVHEGIRLADKSGWVAIGEGLPEENQEPEIFKVGQLRFVNDDMNKLKL